MHRCGLATGLDPLRPRVAGYIQQVSVPEGIFVEKGKALFYPYQEGRSSGIGRMSHSGRQQTRRRQTTRSRMLESASDPQRTYGLVNYGTKQDRSDVTKCHSFVSQSGTDPVHAMALFVRRLRFCIRFPRPPARGRKRRKGLCFCQPARSRRLRGFID